ncbi:hypothetical protein GBAR_LOCUS7727 [Geodia barretti]|uniref:Uncharacterized protein n=1 Tax=Geodia barretti TaxID=519541 RepID=A0AA35RKM6_GEOBA|nr:hypothetical protein GBAR_LOCUS7727 [Geodia barretti]
MIKVYRVHATCILNVPSATQVVLCCNNTDYCNENLNPDDRLLTDPSMSLTPSPQLTDESPTNEEQMQRTIGPNVEVIVGSVGAVVIVIVAVVSVVALVMFLGFLYSRRARRMSSI